MIYKMELIDSVDDMIFPLLEVPIADKDITGIADNTTVDGNVFRDYLWLKKQWTQKWSIMCQDEYNRLRCFWLRQFGNAEVPFYRLFYGENRYEDRNTFTVNGFVQIENDAPLYSPLSLTQLLGNATQKTLSGKNLWGGFPADFTNNLNGITFNTKADGIFTAQGTATGNAWSATLAQATTNNLYVTLDAGTYTKSTADALPTGVYLQSFNADTSTELTGAAFTLTGTTKIVLRLNVSSGVNISSGITVRPMLEKSATATAYEPYCGGIPSPNPSYPQDVNVVSGAQEVKITGKNLFEKIYASDKTQNGITMAVSADKQSLTLNGTTTSGGMVYIVPEMESQSGFFKAGTYTLSVSQYPSRGNFRIEAFDAPSGGTKIRTYDSSVGVNTYTFTLLVDAYLRISFIVWAGQSDYTFTDYVIDNIQLELDSTATTFEPYQGQSQEIILPMLGKNKYDGAIEQGAISTTTGKNEPTQASNRCRLIGYNVIKPSTQYTISATGTNLQDIVIFYDERFEMLSYTIYNAIPHTFTTPSGAKYIRFTFRHSDNSNISPSDTTQIQLELGSSATTYEAPDPLELAKIGNYTDGIKQVGDKWYIHKEIGKVILDGSEGSWIGGAFGGYWRANILISGIRPISTNDEFVAFCDYFHKDIAVLDSAHIKEGDFFQHRINSRLYFAPPISVQSKANWLTWLSTHNTTVYYALATPTDTEITDADLIEQLNHIYSLYGGVNNIMLIPSAGAQGEINFKYRLNYEQETDIVPKTPVVLTLSDGGVINTCGCRENIQLIMRETTQGNSES